MATSTRITEFILFFSLIITGLQINAAEENKINFSADLYGSQENLMPYKGYQNDLSATAYAQYSDFPVFPFARFVSTNYYFLNSSIINNTAYTSDLRTAAGAGLDYKLNQYFRIRLISEQIYNKSNGQTFNQPSYGIIYNQYIKLTDFELNNYLETFYIPRLSERLNTYLKIQALKSFVVKQNENSSSSLFPFAQARVKHNDDAIFGISGQNVSLGAGYKYFRTEGVHKYSFLLEGHAVTYQSRDLNGDWLQLMAAVQWLIN